MSFRKRTIGSSDIWQVQWRDSRGRQLCRTFAQESEAKEFERLLAKTGDPQEPVSNAPDDSD